MIALLAAFALLVVAGAARAEEDPPGRVGRVASIEGEVRTVDADGAWVPLPLNRPLTTGDRVITDKDARAVLEIGSTTVRLGAYTDVHFTRLDDQIIRLHFDHGQMALRVRSAAIVGELGVETDEGVWVPQHPGYFRFDRTPDGVIAAQAWSGDLLLQAPDSSLPLAAGQRAEVWREGAQETTHYRMVPALVDKFSDWALVEDRLDDRAAGTTTAGAAASPLPVEMTGGADLARYGSWSTDPDYGSVWTPTSVAPGWAPYQDGNWSWVAPWGWTWVDAAPWGFAPFHYGRWAYVHDRWCWAPGSWGPRPIYAPALVGWFGGEGFAVDGSPAVGWVPLAPDELFYPGYEVSPLYWGLVNASFPQPRLPRRTVLPVPRRPVTTPPTGPITYANRGAPGAVSIVPTSALTMPVMQRPDHRRAFAEATQPQVTALPPPAPPEGRSSFGRVLPTMPGADGGARTAPTAPALRGPAPPRTTPTPTPMPPPTPMRPAAGLPATTFNAAPPPAFAEPRGESFARPAVVAPEPPAPPARGGGLGGGEQRAR